MTEDNKDVQSPEVNAKNAPSKPRELREKNKPLTKIIIRRLPPSMEKDSFLEQVSPIPEYDYLYFVKPDSTLGSCAYSRAYINFLNVDDIFVFRDKFDGYIFLDEKGVEYPGIVEYAPFQRIPRKRRKRDPKCGTIESDPAYLDYLDSLKETDNESKEPKLEFSYQPAEEEKTTPQSTPLLEFLAARRAEKVRVREERRLRDAERRKPRNTVVTDKRGKDIPVKDDNQDNDIKKIKPRDNDKDKLNKKKDDFTQSRTAFGYSDSKEGKTFGKPAGKSYKDQKRLDDRRKDFDKRESFKSKEATPREFDVDKNLRKDKKDKQAFSKERVKEVKKYSDTRKDREKFKYMYKSDSKVEGEKLKSHDSENKSSHGSESKSDNKMIKFGGDIIPVTKLPVMEDLSRVIDEMDKNVNRLKLDGSNSEEASSLNNDFDTFAEMISKKPSMVNKLNSDGPISEEATILNHDFDTLAEMIMKKPNIDFRSSIKPFNNPSMKPFDHKHDDQVENIGTSDASKKSYETKDVFQMQKKGDFRRNSLESVELIEKEESSYRRHKSLEDKSKSEERDGSDKEEDNKNNEQSDPRVERRIKNKDRPSMVIYQPGMGRFSKNRITNKDKEISKTSCSKDSTDVKEN